MSENNRWDGLINLVVVLFVLLACVYVVKSIFFDTTQSTFQGECTVVNCGEVFWGAIAYCNRHPDVECIRIKYNQSNALK